MNKDIVVLVPILDPDVDITNKFLTELKKKFTNIVFINVGSNAKFDSFFANLEKKYPVIKHHLNLGKGRGIKNGINYILNNYENAKVIVTADCDGQHTLEDIINVSNTALKNLNALVLGVRDFNDKNVPFKSKNGNKITKNIFKVLLGHKISDTQTGLRAMSYDVAKAFIETEGERYEYETKVLIEAKNKNIPIIEVGIKTVYIEDNKTSHYQPLRDSIRIYRKFTKYFIALFLGFFLEIYLFNKLNSLDFNIYFNLLLSKILFILIYAVITKYINIMFVSITLILEVLLALLLKGIAFPFIIVKIIIDILVLLLFIFAKK